MKNNLYISCLAKKANKQHRKSATKFFLQKYLISGQNSPKLLNLHKSTCEYVYVIN